MKILKIISVHKHIAATPTSGYRIPQPLKKGKKRVEAIVIHRGQMMTKHVDIPK